jgi:hypothetical protein
MKSVYAYNPDYDQLQVNVGEIVLQDYSPNINSNLLSTKAILDLGDYTLNDFIYFGPIKISDYINNLHAYSISFTD